MVDWDGRIEIGNGCKDVSVSYCFWNMSVQSNIINIDTKPSEKLTSLVTNKTHLKEPIESYQFEPSAELLHSSSEELCKEDKDENNERLTNTDW